MVLKILFMFYLFIVGEMCTRYFHSFFRYIKAFHATECHIYPFHYTNTSYFVVLELNLETRENLRKILKISKTEFSSFKKKVVSSALAV